MKTKRVSKRVRVIYWLGWWGEYHTWLLTQGARVIVPLTGPKLTGVAYERLTKREATRRSRAHCRDQWEKHGELCELVIRTKRGPIGKGPSSRATYGEDPRRYPG